ncbi:MAG: hypothetical protein LBJ31_04970 [Treponema sp.]|jgi:hypothetical protein|nr:hypothetical protein [Treponema sp.]
MALIPVENIKYISELDKDEIINRLKENIEPQSFLSRYGKEYYGEINENDFKIMRRSIFKNPYGPIISGDFEQNNNKTIINVKMKINLLVIIFMITEFLIINIILPIVFLVTSIIEKEDVIISILITIL